MRDASENWIHGPLPLFKRKPPQPSGDRPRNLPPKPTCALTLLINVVSFSADRATMNAAASVPAE